VGGFVEPGIVRTKTGRIVAGLRNHGPENAIWVTYSDDDGKVGSRDERNDRPPGRLDSAFGGRLMASRRTYATRATRRRTSLLQQRQRSDLGHSNEVQIRNDFSNWDVGYQSRSNYRMPSVDRVLRHLFGNIFLGGTYWRRERFAFTRPLPALSPAGRSGAICRKRSALCFLSAPLLAVLVQRDPLQRLIDSPRTP